MTLSILIGKEGTNVKTVPAATTKDKKQEQQQEINISINHKKTNKPAKK